MYLTSCFIYELKRRLPPRPPQQRPSSSPPNLNIAPLPTTSPPRHTDSVRDPAGADILAAVRKTSRRQVE
ncbi:hypothetical protein LTR28_000494, partial [Elasticomyces elasticus]